MQDEPGRGVEFSRKVSPKGNHGMLRVDHQHGRFTNDQPGVDPGVPGGQRRDAVCRPAPRGYVPLGGANPPSTPVRQPETGRERIAATVHRTDGGLRPRPGHPVAHSLQRDRPCESRGLSTHPVRHDLHAGRFGSVGLRRPGACEPQRASHASDPGTGVPRIRSGSLPTVSHDLGGAPLPPEKHLRIPPTQHHLPADQAHGDSHRGAAQAPIERSAWVPAHRHRAPRGTRLAAKGCITSMLSTR
jgi:hypothetical protein